MENDDNFIGINDILNMERCIVFLKNIKENKLNARDFIELLKIELKEKHDILYTCQNFISNYNQIKILQKFLDKSEALKFKIQKIFNGSTFILSNNMKSPIECIFDGMKESK